MMPKSLPVMNFGEVVSRNSARCPGCGRSHSAMPKYTAPVAMVDDDRLQPAEDHDQRR